MLFLCKQKFELAGRLPPDNATPWSDRFCHWQTQWSPGGPIPTAFSVHFPSQAELSLTLRLGSQFLSWSLWLPLPGYKRLPSGLWRARWHSTNQPSDLSEALNLRAWRTEETPCRMCCPNSRKPLSWRVPVLDRDFLALPSLWDDMFF